VSWFNDFIGQFSQETKPRPQKLANIIDRRTPALVVQTPLVLNKVGKKPAAGSTLVFKRKHRKSKKCKRPSFGMTSQHIDLVAYFLRGHITGPARLSVCHSLRPSVSYGFNSKTNRRREIKSGMNAHQSKCSSQANFQLKKVRGQPHNLSALGRRHMLLALTCGVHGLRTSQLQVQYIITGGGLLNAHQ